MFLKQCGVTHHWDRDRANNYFPSLITFIAKLLQLLSLSRRFIPAAARSIFARNNRGRRCENFDSKDRKWQSHNHERALPQSSGLKNQPSCTVYHNPWAKEPRAKSLNATIRIASIKGELKLEKSMPRPMSLAGTRRNWGTMELCRDLVRNRGAHCL